MGVNMLILEDLRARAIILCQTAKMVLKNKTLGKLQITLVSFHSSMVSQADKRW